MLCISSVPMPPTHDLCIETVGQRHQCAEGPASCARPAEVGCGHGDIVLKEGIDAPDRHVRGLGRRAECLEENS